MNIKQGGMTFRINKSKKTATLIQVDNLYSGRAKIIVPDRIIDNTGLMYTVVSIAKDTFIRSNIKEVFVGKNLQKIEQRAFMFSTIQKFVRKKTTAPLTIEQDAFMGCFELKEVYFGGWTTIGEDCFRGDENLHKIESQCIEVRIPQNAFKDCINLKEFIFSHRIISIQKDAFDGVFLESVLFDMEIDILIDESFLRAIKDAHIVVHEQSPLTNLVYLGYLVEIFPTQSK